MFTEVLFDNFIMSFIKPNFNQTKLFASPQSNSFNTFLLTNLTLFNLKIEGLLVKLLKRIVVAGLIVSE